ncbi:hypothetical protein Rhe02_02770 [Rhizocola hellebori]|uniref:Uncharacterized protein n=1 Tax=Rhizocola hellebori TaxID=1392758 RepID=A0A8J3Q2P6_9ACTN|nr:hypothetical protein [Rhizocola hellebori]GIH02210.1 hypothetical protein Rhe02_02770 [Rhizocola hellebori]
MNLHAPFTGTILLPDKAFPTGVSPVHTPDGRVVAQIRWHALSMRGKFEVLDPFGREVASGGSESMTGRKMALRDPRGTSLAALKLSLMWPSGTATLSLPGGTEIGVKKATFSERKFAFTGAAGEVARITPTTGVFSFHPDAYAFEALRPELTVVVAIGIAQCLREATKSTRNSRN